MITQRLRSLKRGTRRWVANAAWGYLMKPAREGWGRKPYDEAELKLLRAALVNQNLSCINGQMVPAFEAAFANLHDVPFAVASSSGTAAIHVAIGALDLEPGDEIITAPITDLGTIIPILSQGCIPVFADVDHTYNIDPADVERKITSRTRAILAVHLFGNPCDMDALTAIAARHGLVLIEDCAQAHLALYRGRPVGTIGDIGCFSFQQSKHMTTGDGGMTITSNAQYHARMRLFADKGYARKGYGSRAYLFHAPNYRMTELVGAVGLAQLRKLPGVVERRRIIGAHLTRRFADLNMVTTAPTTPHGVHSFWLYALTVRGSLDIGRISRALASERVNAMVGYTGKPIYLCSESLTAKRTYGTSQWPFSAVPGVVHEYKEGLCPRAEAMLEHLICLPFDESWTTEEADRVVDAVTRALREAGTAVASPIQPSAARGAPPSTMTGGRPRLRVGIIGCGQMGRRHLDAYRANPDVELVAFSDMMTPKAEAFAAETGGRAYQTHEAMLAAGDLDAVSICTVPVSHRQIATDALRAGVHILCEKPLAASVADADAMCAEAAAAERVLQAAFKFRFYEEVQKARDLLQSRALGPIIQARLMFGGLVDMTDTWYAQPELSGGGVLMDNGPHAFDLLRYLFGDISSVTASVAAHHRIDVEDTAHISCTLAEGGVATVDLSWVLSVPAGNYLEIYGTQGAALLDGNGISYRLQGWPDWKRVSNTRGVHEAFAQHVDEFVAVVGGAPSQVLGPDDGRRAQQLIDAAYQSVRLGRAVDLIVTPVERPKAVEARPMEAAHAG